MFDMEVKFDYKMDRGKLFYLVVEFAKEYPDAVEAILRVVEQKKEKWVVLFLLSAVGFLATLWHVMLIH